MKDYLIWGAWEEGKEAEYCFYLALTKGAEFFLNVVFGIVLMGEPFQSQIIDLDWKTLAIFLGNFPLDSSFP